ncbi:outer membrane efflux protein, TolC family, putative CusC [Arcobacter acticola]|uniref:Outer membrane efflux protein, TolC family, putative CusC n=1 Tax=Arcobacter acticola TaxID=1849015 RepID=A0A6M8ESK8_9BACT|nr:TolC family protein [Arcobacter acticola]QKE27377.1 outer membrane efflux protein, TolC family, putative CusC [Arcobacter acticola]
MKKILLCFSLTVCLLSAVTIDELVKNTNENNYDLKSIDKSIEVANHQISLSKKWQNPTLSLGLNDLWLNDLSSRDKEAMQASFIGLSQVIPTGSKLEIKEKIAQKDRNIQILNLEDKKLELESKVYEYVYTILLLEKKYNLLESYEQNIKKLEALFTSLYKYQKVTQNEILNSQISALDIGLQKQNLKNMIDNSYLKLEQITYTKIDKIDENIDIKKINLLTIKQEHPKFKTLEEMANKSKNMADLEAEKKIPDLMLNVAYFQRDSKFNDYVNVSVSFPLPIYDTENTARLQAKMNMNETNDRLEQLKHNFSMQGEILKNSLNSSYTNYNLIEEKIIPIKEKIQKNIETYNSFDKIKPQESIKNLNELISYETKAIDELQKYYEAYSALLYFTNKGIK